MSTKKRGAPRGNHNALKHGFYSAAFKEHERRLLARQSSVDLASEIDLIRIANFRLMQALTQSSAPLEVDRQLAILRAVTLSTYTMTALLRAQQWMSFVATEPVELPALVTGEPAQEKDPASTEL